MNKDPSEKIAENLFSISERILAKWEKYENLYRKMEAVANCALGCLAILAQNEHEREAVDRIWAVFVETQKQEKEG